MPPKRKALSEAPSNASNAQPQSRTAKSAKTSKTSTAPKAAVKTATKMSKKVIKYCNANTLSEEPKYANLQWPDIADFIDDKDQDMPAQGELMDEYCYRTSDLGFPVSEDGVKICEHIDDEMEKRDQNSRDMYIYNDWNGWGMREVWENLLKDFNRDIFKKTISPYKKYAYIEGMAAYIKSGDLVEFIGNEDGDSVKAVTDFLGLMIITVYDMLKEHDLLVASTLTTKIKNLETIALLLIEFLFEWCGDLDQEWGCEVVRYFDEAGIDLEKSLRKQIDVSAEQIRDLRDKYKEKEGASSYAEDEEDHGNGYVAFAKKKDWKPADDVNEYGRKMFYRWDWKTEYNIFKKEYAGGKHYDLSKMSKAERKQYEL